MCYIARNSYPVFKEEAVGCCETLRTIYYDSFVYSLVQSERVTTAWIKFYVCRALYTVYKMKVMQQSLLGVLFSKFYNDETKSNDATVSKENVLI
jgi:hypothetical protein